MKRASVYTHKMMKEIIFLRPVHQSMMWGVRNGQWEKLLKRQKIKRGDFFQIPSGTIHAIQKDTKLLEIQGHIELIISSVPTLH